jgi:hypothetical protein
MPQPFGFPGVKCLGHGTDHHPILAPGSSRGKDVPQPPVSACLAHNGTAVLFTFFEREKHVHLIMPKFHY